MKIQDFDLVPGLYNSIFTVFSDMSSRNQTLRKAHPVEEILSVISVKNFKWVGKEEWKLYIFKD